ncbi:hypothetical protein [Psychroserpens sp. MEBiC05023]
MFKYLKRLSRVLLLVFSTVACAQNEGVYLVAEVSNETVSVGQTTEVTYKLYVSQSTGVSNWKELQKPEYKGFESSEIVVEPMQVKTEKFKGETHRYVILNKTKLTSKEKGTFLFDPLKLNVTIEIFSDDRSTNEGLKKETLNKDLISEPIKIIVK